MTGDVITCPMTKEDWEVRATAMKNCIFSYHCLQNTKGFLGEYCIERTTIGKGHCPYIASNGRLDWKNCSLIEECPKSSYASDELYKYPVCYQNLFTNQRITTDPTGGETTLETDQTSSSIIAATMVSIIIVLVILAIIVIVILHRRNSYGLRDWINEHICRRLTCRTCMRNDQQPKTLEDVAFIPKQDPTTPTNRRRVLKNDTSEESAKKLEAVSKLYSLVLFLKELPRKCDLNIEKKLNKAKFLYKKSFIDDLSSDQLQCIENGNFKELTNSTVFIFLTNLCGFEKPTRGWENPPLIKDVSLEADIARIRILWNGMCDGNVDEKTIRETFQRLRDHFGEISIADVQIMGPKEKITWKQLKPDCEIDKEEHVVLTEKVKDIIQRLEEGDLAVCTGVIGSGKSEALKYVVEKYRKDGWNVEWVEKLPLSTDIQKASGEKVLLCCDNLFGDVSYEYFTLAQLKDVKNLLEKCSQEKNDSKTQKLKLLISIQKHVLQELVKDRRENFDSLTNFNFTVDMDKLTSAELYLIFKETIRKGCQSHTNCWYEQTDFSAVETKLKKNSGKVGNPCLLMAFAKNHSLFADDTFPKKPIDVLVQNFKRLRSEEPKSFYILLYILFVREHHKNTELKKWAQELPTPLNREDLDDVGKTNIAAYLHTEGDTIRISHELFQIALFQCIPSKHIDTILKFCDLHTMLSICRPNDALEEFSVRVIDKDIEHLKSRDQCKDLILKTGHPFKRFFESETTLIG